MHVLWITFVLLFPVALCQEFYNATACIRGDALLTCNHNITDPHQISWFKVNNTEDVVIISQVGNNPPNVHPDYAGKVFLDYSTGNLNMTDIEAGFEDIYTCLLQPNPGPPFTDIIANNQLTILCALMDPDTFMFDIDKTESNKDVSFTASVDADPPANISLTFKRGETLVKNVDCTIKETTKTCDVKNYELPLAKTTEVFSVEAEFKYLNGGIQTLPVKKISVTNKMLPGLAAGIAITVCLCVVAIGAGIVVIVKKQKGATK